MTKLFFKTKKVALSILTITLLASLATGCANSDADKMLGSINTGERVKVEVALPDGYEQQKGTIKQYNWVELDKLDTYEDFRDKYDDAFSITNFGENSKSGVIYVDLEGNQCGNSCLYYAMNNKQYMEKWKDSTVTNSYIPKVKEIYVDVETNRDAVIASINAYYNLFADSEPNYFNGNTLLTRAEFYGGLYRAANPVKDLETNKETAFKKMVDPENQTIEDDFANEIADNIYLDIESKNLNNDTFHSTITRAEAIYTIVKLYYNEEYESLSGKEKAYTDTKNAGNIALKNKFIEEDKEGTVNKKDYWKAYELQYAIKNADKGLPEELYKAMIVAYNHNLMTSEETNLTADSEYSNTEASKDIESNWEQGLTKKEAITLILNTYKDLGYKINVARGEFKGEDLSKKAVDSDKKDTKQADNNTQLKKKPSLNKSEVTLNSDGSYSFSDSYIQAVKNIKGMERFNDQEINEILNGIGNYLISYSDRAARSFIESEMAFYEPSGSEATSNGQLAVDTSKSEEQATTTPETPVGSYTSSQHAEPVDDGEETCDEWARQQLEASSKLTSADVRAPGTEVSPSDWSDN